MKYLITTAVAVSLLSGCTEVDKSFTAFNQEAGAQLESGNFGNATMNNTLVQSGQRDYVVSLGHRFNSEVESTVTFAFNSAQLDNVARATLSQQAHWINQFPEVRFKVFGHTDLVGSNAYNKALGLRRAQAAVNYLVSQGVSRSRLKAVVSFGETRPVIKCFGSDCVNLGTQVIFGGVFECCKIEVIQKRLVQLELDLTDPSLALLLFVLRSRVRSFDRHGLHQGLARLFCGCRGSVWGCRNSRKLWLGIGLCAGFVGFFIFRKHRLAPYLAVAVTSAWLTAWTDCASF